VVSTQSTTRYGGQVFFFFFFFTQLLRTTLTTTSAKACTEKFHPVSKNIIWMTHGCLSSCLKHLQEFFLERRSPEIGQNAASFLSFFRCSFFSL
jgi:hypothetical protein